MSTPIKGNPQATMEQAQKWAASRNAHQSFIDVAPFYWELAPQVGIRPEVLYAQSAKETAFGRYGGAVKREQNNWAGIKTANATGDTTSDFESFPTARDGVRGHVNHMCAYVGSEPIGTPHGRYSVVKSLSWAGTVRNVEELTGKWAVDPRYSESLIRDYLKPLLATPAPEPAPEPEPDPEPEPEEGFWQRLVRWIIELVKNWFKTEK